MSATLIYGEHEAVLVDAFATFDQADALADWIDTKGRRLSRIYITHGTAITGWVWPDWWSATQE
jgi:glyoxylase-like metal-dependent hydrolase (beta-lactamase superfamily II)